MGHITSIEAIMKLNVNAIYLNHEIIADERSWPLIEAAASHSDKGVFVVSQYNLIEAAGGSCQSQIFRRLALHDAQAG